LVKVIKKLLPITSKNSYDFYACPCKLSGSKGLILIIQKEKNFSQTLFIFCSQRADPDRENSVFVNQQSCHRQIMRLLGHGSFVLLEHTRMMHPSYYESSSLTGVIQFTSL